MFHTRVTGSIAVSLALALAPRAGAADPDPPPGDVRATEDAPAETTRVLLVQEPPRWPLWAGVGVAAAAAATGSVFGFAALSAANDGDRASDPRSPATGANVAFTIAGTAALITGVLWLWQDVIGGGP